MDVDQVDGTICVLFYDRRNHSDQNTDVYLAYSTDGGESFTNVKVSDTPFDPSPGIFFGDYTNIHVYDGKIAPIWARMQGGQTSIWTAQLDIATLIHSAPGSQQHFMLSQNVPNPFSEVTSIEINVEEAGVYSLTLIDMIGRSSKNLIVNEFLQPGTKKITLDAGALQLHDGVYYYSLRKGNTTVTKKLVIVNP